MKIEITKPKKLFFKNPDITKGEIISYYKKIAPFMIPHTFNRPANLMRAPDGILGEIFFQQNMPAYFPKWIGFYDVKRLRGGIARHVLVNRPETMVYLANSGVVTLHIWNSRIDGLNNPDRIVFDLDPPNTKNGFELVRETAFNLKKMLEKIGFTPYAMLTGSKGVHVVVPLKPDASYKETKVFIKQIIQKMKEKYPGKVTDNFLKSNRTNKVFIDYLRNNYGQTAVAPYSVRLKTGAPVAAPVFWKDLEKKKITSQSFNIKNIFSYLKKGDPWKGMYDGTKSVTYYIKKLKDN